MLLLISFTFLLGLFIGSFLNVCIDRLPIGQSIITRSSHCPACQRRLAVADLIPLLSYIFLRGRCRYCRAKIPIRVPLVEGITALMFSFLTWQLGFGFQLAAFLVYACFLIIIFVIDLERHLVLDTISYPAMALAFAFSFFLPVPSVRSALVGGAAGSGVMALIYYTFLLLFRREGLGFGDVKMAAVMGLMLGYPLVFVALFISWIAGGAIAAALLLLKSRKRTDMIPTATFMAISTMITLLWGQKIILWYLPSH